MNTLLFDAGNTRLKWALVKDGRIGPQQATAVTELQPLAAFLRRAPAVDRVVGVSVAGTRMERGLRAVLRNASLPRPEFLTSTAKAGGVTNGYRNPALLGADRWAAAIAAWQRAGCYRTVCAVSVGTALTIDVVDQDGQHGGGLIAPGPELMLSSLLKETHGIAAGEQQDRADGPRRRPRSAPAPASPLADSTSEAIREGCLAAAAGFVDRTVTLLTRRLGVRPVVFITGGGSAAVVERMRSACKPCEDLVLRGVAAMAEVPIRRRA